MRKLTSSLYLTVLAVSDTIALYSGPLRWWILHLTDVDIASSSPGLCKFSNFMEYASADISAWTLVVLTTQRFVSVWFPTKSRTDVHDENIYHYGCGFYRRMYSQELPFPDQSLVTG